MRLIFVFLCVFFFFNIVYFGNVLLVLSFSLCFVLSTSVRSGPAEHPGRFDREPGETYRLRGRACEKSDSKRKSLKSSSLKRKYQVPAARHDQNEKTVSEEEFFAICDDYFLKKEEEKFDFIYGERNRFIIYFESADRMAESQYFTTGGSSTN